MKKLIEIRFRSALFVFYAEPRDDINTNLAELTVNLAETVDILAKKSINLAEQDKNLAKLTRNLAKWINCTTAAFIRLHYYFLELD